MAEKQLIFDLNDCVSCSICVQACPVSALELTLMGKSGKYVNLFPKPVPGACIGCGICVKSCPMSCIRIGDADES